MRITYPYDDVRCRFIDRFWDGIGDRERFWGIFWDGDGFGCRFWAGFADRFGDRFRGRFEEQNEATK